jgi:hypothetical protein
MLSVVSLNVVMLNVVVSNGTQYHVVMLSVTMKPRIMNCFKIFYNYDIAKVLYYWTK